MKVHDLVFVLIFGMMTTFACARLAAQTTEAGKTMSPLEQTFIGNEKTVISAEKKHDSEYVKRTLAENYTRVGVDGELHQQQDAIDEISGSEAVDLIPYDFAVVQAGDDTVIVTYNLVVQVAPAEDQGPPPRYQRISSVWVKQGGAWKLKFQQATAAHWGDW